MTDTPTALGLEILSTHPPSRRVRVAGTVARLGRIFGTTLSSAISPGQGQARVTHRQRTGGLSVPSSLAGIVTAVLGSTTGRRRAWCR